ncbi:IS110 family transposase [Candidatus Poribacteria bacterium]|nr:IS110 family transposase [Candidatus Poribacteria bacterium]
MRFYNRQHRHYCGIDLHVKTMYVCILDSAGQVLVHRNVPSTREAFLEIVAPYRDDLVVAAECMFTWYWLADVCAAEGITFVLGHAWAMKAIHGGKAKNDKIDSHKIASLLRGGLLPQAYVYPAAMRSTRDLIRRRLHLVRKRGQLLAHIQNTRAQYNLPVFGRKLAYRTNRAGVVEHFSDPSVQKSIEVDLALIDQYDTLIVDLELTIVREAKRHNADAFHRLRSVPGIGKVLALTILYEIHDIARFDRVQEFASYARLVKCQHQSGGKTLGTGGAKMGNVHLKWAFSEAAVLFLRHTEGKQLIARIEKQHGKGKALSILAHKIGRAVFYILSRGTVFSMEKFRAA